MAKKTVSGRTSTLTPVAKATRNLMQLPFRQQLTTTIMEAWLHPQSARVDIALARGLARRPSAAGAAPRIPSLERKVEAYDLAVGHRGSAPRGFYAP